MPFTGRYHLVRNWWIPTGKLSPLLVLDRRDKALYPYRGSGDSRAQWEPMDDRRALMRKLQQYRQRVAAEPTLLHKVRLAEQIASRDADLQRIAALFGKGDLFPTPILSDSQLSNQATLALDSNYVAGTSGDAYAARYAVPVGGKTLNSVYFYVNSYTGTAANVNDINLEVRPEASALAVTPDTGTLTASATKDPASATGWVASTGWTAALTALAKYFIIVGDADGNGTDNAVMLTRSDYDHTTVSNAEDARFGHMLTTTGWASGNSAVSRATHLVLGFSDSTAIGMPLTTNTTPASDTNRRGLRITTAGLIANVPIFGALWFINSGSGVTGIEIYNNANVPGTSPDNTSTDLIPSLTNTQSFGCLTSGGTPYTLSAGTAYRIVATYGSAATTGPRRMDVGTGEDATLRLAMPGAGEFYFTRANDTTDWTNDLVGSVPTMGLLVDGQVAAAGGGIASLINGGLIR